MNNKDQNKPAKRRPYARQACQRCRSMKVKCINNNDGTPCERCLKGSHKCVYTERKKRTTKAKKQEQLKQEHQQQQQQHQQGFHQHHDEPHHHHQLHIKSEFPHENNNNFPPHQGQPPNQPPFQIQPDETNFIFNNGDGPFNPDINMPPIQPNEYKHQNQDNYNQQQPQYDDLLATPTLLDPPQNFPTMDNPPNRIDPSQDFYQPPQREYMNNTHHNMEPPPHMRQQHQPQQQQQRQQQQDNPYQTQSLNNNELNFLEFPTEDVMNPNLLASTPDGPDFDDLIFDSMSDVNHDDKNQRRNFNHQLDQQSILPYDPQNEPNWNRPPSQQQQFSPSNGQHFLPEPYDEHRNFETQPYHTHIPAGNNNQFNSNPYQPIPLPGVPFDVYFNRQHQKIMLSINSQQLQSFRQSHPIAEDCYRKLMSDLQFKSQQEKVEAVGSLVMLLVKYFTPSSNQFQEHPPQHYQLTNKTHR